jgi:uncharacterized protein with NRDE domain
MEPRLLSVMASDTVAPDEALPLTGVSLEMERVLSSPFIRTPAYGTRCTSLLSMDADGQLRFFERRFDAQGKVAGESREAFAIVSSAEATGA